MVDTMHDGNVSLKVTLHHAEHTDHKDSLVAISTETP